MERMRRFTLVFAASWIFLPGRYTHQPPRRPYVEALPDPRETTEVWSWGHTRLQDRNGGWYRYERVSPRSYRPW